MNWDKIIEQYEAARTALYEAARANNNALMGDDAWLGAAMQPEEITFYTTEDGFNCWGMTYTTQTMSHEQFNFDIPKAAFEKFYAGTRN